MSEVDKRELRKSLYKKFVKIRLTGHRNDYSETDSLLTILKYDDSRNINDNEMDALLIKFVFDKIHNLADRDMLLMAFRLLCGYDGDEIRMIGSRRRRYIFEANFITAEELASCDACKNDCDREKILENVCNRLEKQENVRIRRLCSGIANISNISSYINEENKHYDKKKYRAKIPKPSYKAKEEIETPPISTEVSTAEAPLSENQLSRYTQDNITPIEKIDSAIEATSDTKETKLPRPSYSNKSEADYSSVVDGSDSLTKEEVAKPIFPDILEARNFTETDTEINNGIDISQQTAKEKFILTPKASLWENQRLFGRDKFIDDLCQELCDGNARHLQITGMGGIGKSEILNRIYVNIADNRIKHSFDHVGLLSYNGSLAATLSNGFLYFEDNRSDKIWKYLRGLCAKRSVLLLIDDIREEQTEKFLNQDESFRELLSLKITILFASRIFIDEFENREVFPLLTKDCIQIFQRQRYIHKKIDKIPALKETDDSLLVEIIEKRAGNNTLIVARLGAMTREYGWSISQLADKLKEREFNIRKKMDSDEELQTEINKLYRVEDIRSSAERNVLEVFALFPDIPLDQKFCIESLKEDSGINNEDDFMLLLTKLSSHTWLTQHHNEEDGEISYSMHPMVKSALHKQIEDINLKNHKGLMNSTLRMIEFCVTKGEFLVIRPYMPFYVALVEFFRKKNFELALLSTALIAGYYIQSVDFDNALKFLQKALDSYEEKLDPELWLKAAIYQYIGCAYQLSYHFEKSLEYLHKALTIIENMPKDMRPDSMQIYESIAFIYHEQNNYDKELECLLKLSDMYMCTSESEQSIADIYGRIMEAYSQKGDHSTASEWKQKNLELLENNSETEYSNIADIRAKDFEEQGNISEALVWRQKDLDARVNKFGLKHPMVAHIYVEIARIYRKLSDYSKAMKYLQMALEIYMEKYGFENLLLANVFLDIADLLYDQKDYQGAIEQYEKVLAIFDHAEGSEHPIVAKAYPDIASLIASLYCIKGNFTKGLEWFYKSLHSYETRLGPDHGDTADLKRRISFYEAINRNFLLRLKLKLKTLRRFKHKR